MRPDVQIVLVEDDSVDAESVRRALRKGKIGNPLVVFADGQSAIDALKNRGPQPLHPPYIVLLDLNMPRMNGLEFLAELRSDSRLQSTVVFVLTTSCDERDVRAAYRANVAGYIVKSKLGGFADVLRMLEPYSELVELPGEART